MKEPELNSEFKKNFYRVPDDYFESFDAKIIARINNEHKHLSVWRKPRVWRIAAVLLLAAGLSVMFYNQQPSEKVDLVNAAVSQAELVDFQEETDVSDDEFMELLNPTQVDSIYHIEVLAVGYNDLDESALELIDEEYSPLEDEIEI